MLSSSDKWKHFERLVTAIHQAADQGAEVKWNDVIGGRQFDVTIRFRRGLYDYLTVIECKDFDRPVPVEKVEAFVTKATDAHADRAVMASTSGFQAGAHEVARKHKITLIHVTDSEHIDLSFFQGEWTGTTEALCIELIELEYETGERWALPVASNAMTYYVHQTLLECGSQREVLGDFLQRHLLELLGSEIGVFKEYVL